MGLVVSMGLKVKIMAYSDMRTQGLEDRQMFQREELPHSQGARDGNSRFLENIGTCLPNYMVPHPKRL
jgi:hypothetical protein